MSTCPTCSEEGSPGALFCGSCGSRLVAGPSSQSPVDPFVGQTLSGRYLIQQKIGSGGMGDVYKAIHSQLESPVALKIVKPALIAHSAMVHRFQREARAASRLHHPNVVAVTDFGQSEAGVLFMVMEYVAGKSLAQVIADDAPLTERRVVHIGAQILSALAEAHANHILHRDLKPENVMIERRRDVLDSVKVLDFGIAKMLAVGAGASTLTQAGLVCGTPGYMSPEQLRGGDVDARSDLFSLGVVLYEMLTHKLPFDAQTPMDMLHRQLSEPIPPPSQRRGRPVSPDLESLVVRALSAAREERPESAEEMREELLGAALSLAEDDDMEQGLATEVLPRGDPSRPEATPRRSTPPRSGAAPARASPPPASTREILPEGRKTTPRAERTRSRPTVPRRDSASEAAAGKTASFAKRVEDRIAPLLGPVAPYLVKKVGLGAATPHDFCQQLAGYLPSDEDRRSFLAWCSAELHVAPARERPPTQAPATTPAAAWDPAVLARARRDLAAYLGPLARIVVGRVCTRARDQRELYELLALEIPSEADREAFRRLTPRDARGA
ncbi:serine/threonine-protein kinase [Anaeromyxobacter terrae]|uniref:serine/threonine-protein kinase n=1 Tax=Anaeromyxobacter terrae TaxID=2925406 RepID=UPI001F585022|nr:serine/threonine-protein kinase [Anaeromyxobacter sp. SG22]